jgi:hypothetical protein
MKSQSEHVPQCGTSIAENACLRYLRIKLTLCWFFLTLLKLYLNEITALHEKHSNLERKPLKRN